MCGHTVLPADHPRCKTCFMLVEPEFNDKTLCYCRKYHNAPSIRDPNHCRKCMGEEVPTGTPRGQPVRIEDDEEEGTDNY
jgi:hypothetical protein